MRFVCFIFVLLLTWAPISVAAAPLLVSVTLEQNSEADWIAEYKFSKPIPGFVFGANQTGHHSLFWEPLDAGVSLSSVRGLDTVWFEVPRASARFKVKPDNPAFTRTILPGREFEDGSTMFFTHEFMILPVKKYKKVEKLKGDVKRWRGQIPEHIMTVKSDKPIFTKGEVFANDASIMFSEFGFGSVIIGNFSHSQTPTYNVVFDSVLSQKFVSSLEADMNLILDHQTQAWGDTVAEPPTIVVRSLKQTGMMMSTRGIEVDGNFLLMEISGKGFQDYKARTRKLFLGTLAHEVAHLFQGRDGTYTSIRSAWIVEGSADLIAYDTLMELGLIKHDEVRSDYADSYDACIDALQGEMHLGRGLNQTRLYDCGGMLALIAHKIAPNHTIYDVWNALIADSEDDRYRGKKFYEILRTFGANPEHVAMLKGIIETQVEASDFMNQQGGSAENLQALMVAVGLNPVFHESGRLIEIDWR